MIIYAHKQYINYSCNIYVNLIHFDTIHLRLRLYLQATDSRNSPRPCGSSLLREAVWLVVSTPLKNISQLGLLFPIYGITVPNIWENKTCSSHHQPAISYFPFHRIQQTHDYGWYKLYPCPTALPGPSSIFHVNRRVPESFDSSCGIFRDPQR